ncbi:MAG: NADH-quinone oxidoreductase subunit NuoH [Candidatus Eisenbacteria bacterium]|uniref:NADH-quinone oxidoreductase subunit H n=1 Tax=Eiseniibacteriota bacterium TaxID=2212470 RepID=A0A948RWK5_UNCEI|nr:NADH-quinone oxidoreductase subunit NuoH [Candidatus Eisenbacteria bacterium]MBU1949246.1 NADH-quinone oxidoreductase subunit NuoH [Candidatus Eisenbacteria bacterium]MBU2689584.1 NADH-quinone oxidoreductase subunit NuoH [Candidatus Eisenbacteria bacterium]
MPPNLVYALSMLFWAVVLLAWLAFLGLYLVWLERKVAARIQSRYGPIYVGGKFGWAQTIADSLKLITKEDLIPKEADRLLFTVAPIIVMTATFASFAALAFGSNLAAADLNIGVFYVLAISSLGVVGIIMGGWASNNKWSLYGAMRAASQIVSYEIPVALSLIGVIMFVGSLSLTEMSAFQEGGIWKWNIFRSPFLFLSAIVYFIASLAEINRTPFDLPEAESELVGGYNTEYSGMKFALFFLAEFANMFVVAAIAAAAFLGGGSGILPHHLLPIPGLINFLIKTFILILIMMWLRWTLPRLRVDQLMYVCWKVLIPASFILMLAVGLQMLVF